MKKTMSIALVITAVLFANSQAHSAAFMKLGDIKGEATATSPTTSTGRGSVETTKPQPVGLLLPAVQQVRETRKGTAKKKKKGNIEYDYKVEEGEKA